ncbi:MAG: inosose dehydratase [Oceanospirillaceae bacterium]|jgi:inosose dehydratase
MKLQLSNAPCSWGVEFADSEKNLPWTQVLDEISMAGYKATELGPLGYLPVDTGMLQESLAKRDLKIIAGTLFQHLHNKHKREEILEFTRRSCKLLAALNAKYMVVIDHVTAPRTDQAGQIATATRLDNSDWKAMMETIRQASDICLSHGITPTLHPHTGTYIEYEDELDRAMQDLPSDLVSLCIDTGHCYYAGMQPQDIISKYADRVKYLHFKDINPQIHNSVVEHSTDFYSAISKGIFCPLGRGGVDFNAVRSTLERIGYQGWVTVEQDMDPEIDNNPLQNAINSRVFIEENFS